MILLCGISPIFVFCLCSITYRFLTLAHPLSLHPSNNALSETPSTLRDLKSTPLYSSHTLPQSNSNISQPSSLADAIGSAISSRASISLNTSVGTEGFYTTQISITTQDGHQGEGQIRRSGRSRPPFPVGMSECMAIAGADKPWSAFLGERMQTTFSIMRSGRALIAVGPLLSTRRLLIPCIQPDTLPFVAGEVRFRTLWTVDGAKINSSTQ